MLYDFVGMCRKVRAVTYVAALLKKALREIAESASRSAAESHRTKRHAQQTCHTQTPSSFSINRYLLAVTGEYGQENYNQCWERYGHHVQNKAQTAARGALAPQRSPIRQHVLPVGSLQSSCRTRTNMRRAVRSVIIANRTSTTAISAQSARYTSKRRTFLKTEPE